MTIDNSWVQGVLADAEAYYQKHDEQELEDLLAQEWVKVKGAGFPTRANDNPGLRIAHRLRRYLATEPEITSATIGTIASQVINHMQTAGYDITDYQIPIAILIAYLVRAVLSEWRTTIDTSDSEHVDE